MKNFKIATNTRFTVDIDLYPRAYSVQKKRNGKIRITNVLDGSILFDNLRLDEILIDGNPIQNTQKLQDVVFNSSCYCDSEHEDEDYKIFDDSFDQTFE